MHAIPAVDCRVAICVCGIALNQSLDGIAGEEFPAKERKKERLADNVLMPVSAFNTRTPPPILVRTPL